MLKVDLDEASKRLAEEFGLRFDPDDPKNSDIFLSRHFKIITRQGIDKIDAKLHERGYTYELFTEYLTETDAVIKGIFKMPVGDAVRTVTTYGEASIDIVKTKVVSSQVLPPFMVGLIESAKSNHELRPLLEIMAQGDFRLTNQKTESQVIRKGNVTNQYYVAMAEKRCKSRGILKVAGFYDHNFYGEDEATAFSDEISKSQSKKSSSKVEVNKLK